MHSQAIYLLSENDSGEMSGRLNAFFTDKEDGINKTFITWHFTSSCTSFTGKRLYYFLLSYFVPALHAIV